MAPRAVLTIVLLGVFGRLYGVAQPLFEIHSMRQHDTAALARNFSEGSMNILYPQVDWRGNTPGYVEAEFQVYTYLVALLYRAFGVHEWLGRVVNIGVFAWSALLLFALIRDLFGEWTGVLGVALYTMAPLSFVFTRTFQPDALNALLSLATIHLFWRWSQTDGLWRLGLSALCLSLAICLKPMGAYLGVPLLYVCHRKFGWRLFRRAELWIYGFCALVPALCGIRTRRACGIPTATPYSASISRAPSRSRPGPGPLSPSS